ncbi:MAG: hypothetical protein N4J56_002901 [Chroococcidiopsis sp. SAG 2025]|nr:hypothetical protein [Chroococcidiopsis sp. SAG 2025]
MLMNTLPTPVIDIRKTEFNTFLDLYQAVILADNPNAKTIDIIKEAKELFNAFAQFV